jgi:hypothetical protein
MRTIALALSALSLNACGSTTIEPYPRDWPALAGMSAGCGEVQGVYADPNIMHWDKVERSAGVVSRTGGHLDAAWVTFAFIDQGAQRSGQRSFSIAFDGPDTLLIGYQFDGKLAASKRLGPDKWQCDKDGLHVTTLERSGALADKLPSHGMMRRSVTLYRVGDALYSKTVNNSRLMLLHALPQHYLDARWQRFDALPPRPDA